MNMKHVCRHLIALVVILFIGQSYSYAAESFLNGNIIQQLQFAKENQIQFKIHPLIQQTEKHLQDYTQTLAQTAAVRMSSVSTPLVHVNDQGDIHVYIYVSEVSEALLTALAESNVHIEIVNEEFNIIQAWVPNDALINIQALPNVTKIDPPSYGVTNAGSVTTEGDAILRADEVRTQGVTGEGARVGVISDGVTSLSTSQSTGDLPANVTVLRSAAGDEGTAMLEIVHDLAPDATLGFCGIQSSLEFINCVNRLRTEFGADIIVDDIGFPSDPTFEDGMIAQTVSNGISNGVLHISAAGNGQQFHHEAEHVSNLTAFPGFDFHDFGIAAGTASDYSMDIILGPSATLTSFLHWNDPYGASSNDYHLGLLDETETTVLAVSAMIQDGNDDPIEAFSYTNPFPFSIIVKLAVERVSGAAGRRLEIQFLQELFQVQEHNIAAGGISGHQAVLNNLTVATINQNEPGNDEIASYSSFGPSRIDFPTLQIRPKPDITGIDCVSITGAGGFSNPFCGTSAAAPHIAGIAALLKSARPTATNTQIRNAITQSAVDLGSAGFDTIYGAGRADAAAAKQNLEVVIPPLSLPEISSPPDGSTFTSATQTFMWDAMGTPVTEWWINLGSTLGGRDIHVSGSLGTAIYQ
jgi:subtilisin family serine protease